MARFDVHEYGGAIPMVLDVQADLLSELNTRMVIPLVPLAGAQREVLPRLKPVIAVGGRDYVMVTTDMAAGPTSALGKRVTNVEDPYRDIIVEAVDFLFQGF
jgi:toxin CcdB